MSKDYRHQHDDWSFEDGGAMHHSQKDKTRNQSFKAKLKRDIQRKEKQKRLYQEAH
ncbi:hypothetical protein [Alteromonas sp. A079]|uniref:hypothetical protein n=1 Tax=Alteromonas sp. A079 TaxID=3410268 RepID=UPI003BA2C24B